MYSIDRYLNVKQAYMPSFSSDGRWLAFISDLTGVPQAWRAPLGGSGSAVPMPEQLTFAEDRVLWLRCSPAPGDTRLLFTRDRGGNENAQLYLLDPTTGQERCLTTGHDGAMHIPGHWSPDGHTLLFAANRAHPAHFRLYRQMLDEGQAALLSQRDEPGLLYDAMPPPPPHLSLPAVASDNELYQTIYPIHSAAAASPTAGLHFDTDMMEQLRAMGVIITYVTLHVGAGTFQQVRVENIADHTMHSETFYIPQATVGAIEHAKTTGGRTLAVGTTSLRALEACASLHQGQLVAGYGDTQIFITPGYRFQVVERLLTNFHLPCSTLLMLVSAFAGIDNIQRAYQHAVTARYRFFSYGDAMLIERRS